MQSLLVKKTILNTILLSTLPDLPDSSGPKKFIQQQKRQRPQPCGFSGPVSHLAKPANDKDAIQIIQKIQLLYSYGLWCLYIKAIMQNYICNIGILVQICDNKVSTCSPCSKTSYPWNSSSRRSDSLSRLDDFLVLFLIRQGLQVQKYVPHEVFCGGCES